MEKGITRTNYIIMAVLAFVPLVMVLIAFPFIPDPMPAHFSLSGAVDRWGSRYESFVMPVIAVVIGSFMIWVTKFCESKDDHIGRMMFFVTSGMSVFFIAIEAFILYLTLTV